MALLTLVRHGLSEANVAGVLAGRSPGVALTESGRAQILAAASLVPAVGGAPPRILTSPIARCAESAALLAESLGSAEPEARDELAEVDYGEWSGRRLADLAREPLWADVLARPSAVRFPGGESLAEAGSRAASALASAQALAAETGDAHIVLVSHGDIIRLAAASVLGMPLDDYQRISVGPGTVTCLTVEPPAVRMLGAGAHAAPAERVLGGGR